MTNQFPKISLKAARINADMTQDEVAERIGRSKQTIVNWESGRTEIKYKDLAFLSDMYEIPIEFLRIS